MSTETHFTCSHGHLGTLHCIIQDITYIMHHAALFLAYRPMASVAVDSNALTHFACINQSTSNHLELRSDCTIHRSGHTHLDMALCPWSPALSAGCQTTTRLT